MRALLLLGSCLVAAVGSSCGSADSCDLPTGCQRSALVAGACQCAEWQVVRVETVPIKFVVVSVVYRGIGNGTWLSYGWTEGSGSMPPASSDLGSRLRVVVRDPYGNERAATIANSDLPATLADPLLPVTAESADVLLAGGGAQGGSAWGFGSALDAPGLSGDEVVVWVNPTLTVTTNYPGEKQASWGWTSVGHCFWPLELPCEGVHTVIIPVEVLAGTRPSGDVYTSQFLDTLTPAERTTILSYHPLYDPPGRDPATLAADPRFLSLGPASVYEGGSSAPVTAWTPCAGTLSDAAFEVLHQTESYFAGSSQKLLLQHSVLSAEAACKPKHPGVALATRTPACALTASVYLDRMFGTLLFVPTDVAASCTRP